MFGSEQGHAPCKLRLGVSKGMLPVVKLCLRVSKGMLPVVKLCLRVSKGMLPVKYFSVS